MIEQPLNSEPQFLPAHIDQRIQVAAEVVADMEHESDVQQYIQDQSNILEALGIVGTTVSLQSEAFCWTAQYVRDDKTVVILVTDKELLAKEYIQGTLSRLDYFTDQNGVKTVAYVLDVGFDDSNGHFLQVMSPVEETIVVLNEPLNSKVEKEMYEEQSYDVDEETKLIKKQLKKLKILKDIGMKGELKFLKGLIDDYDIEDVGTIRYLGMVSSWIMSHPEVTYNNKLLEAVIEIARLLNRGSTEGIFIGDQVKIVMVDDKPKIIREPIECHGSIVDIQLVENYEVDVNGPTPFEDTMQPVFVVVGDGKKVYIPVKHVQSYTVIVKDLVKDQPNDYCLSSLDKFRQTYASDIKSDD